MFGPADFDRPTPPRLPIHQDRAIGAVVLVVAVIACLVLVLVLDSRVIMPYNATVAATQTWQAQNPSYTPPARRTAAPRRTSTPRFYNQEARANARE